MKIRIYVEGGGDSNMLRTKCREGYAKFFDNASLKGRMPSVIACGGRHDAYDDFCTAVRLARQDDFPLLLVDSEAPVTQTAWAHLLALEGWPKPAGASDDHVHLMVQCMEAWFLADRNRLAEFFGQRFRAASLPDHAKVEEIDKARLMQALIAATRHTKTKGAYDKGAHSFALLGLVDPVKVAQVSPHARRLLKTVKAKAGQRK